MRPRGERRNAREGTAHAAHHDAPAGASRAPLVKIMCELVDRAQVAGTLRRDIVAQDLPPLLATIAEGHTDDMYAHRNWQRYMELILDGLCTSTPSELTRGLALTHLHHHLHRRFSAMPTPPSQLCTVPVAVRESRRFAAARSVRRSPQQTA